MAGFLGAECSSSEWCKSRFVAQVALVADWCLDTVRIEARNLPTASVALRHLPQRGENPPTPPLADFPISYPKNEVTSAESFVSSTSSMYIMCPAS